MIPEIGQFALILALMLALMQATLPLIGAARGIPSFVAVAKPAAQAQFIFVAIALSCLAYSFITNDFSVLNVATNSNSQLPLNYRMAATWGSHEGSLLMWTFMLTVWMVAVTLFSNHLPEEMVARVLSVMGVISTGFLLFMLLTSNPFDRLFPVPPEGRDLNPLLQDPAMVAHPPMLYMGYVGFSVAFAFAISALISGKLDATWARWSLPWTTVAWMFLTCGIALGSWWAYYELGWGGWWFWDPVENASFMPWLVGTALIHSLAVTEKRGGFKSWTVLLAIAAFSLSLLGTFMVGSGLLGKFYPLFIDALNLGKLSVGPPYFNTVFVPLMAPAMFLIGVGPIARWKQAKVPELAVRLRWAFVLSLVTAALLPFVIGGWQWRVSLGLLLAFWIVATAVQNIWSRIKNSATEPSFLKRLKSPSRSYYGMQLAHLGVAIFIAGVTVVTAYQTERDVKMNVGDTVTAGGYTFRLTNLERMNGPNYQAMRADVEVTKNGELVANMHPEKRAFNASQSVTSETSIDRSVWRDLYLALGDEVGGGAWTVRVYYKPLVNSIWGGALLMAIGGGFAVTDRRYALVARKQREAAAAAKPGKMAAPAP